MSRAALFPSRFAPLLTSLAAIAAALLLGGVFLATRGKDPVAAYGMLVSRGLLTSYGITETLIHMAPLLIVSAGLLISLRAGVWNIGIDGQLLVGALFAGVAAAAIAGQVANPIMWLIAALAGMAGGLLWALVPGILRVHWGLNEIITTLMMNYVALNVTSWLVKGPVKDPAVVPPQTRLIPKEMRLPDIPGTEVHIGLLVGLVVVIVVTVLFRHTVLGFMLDVLGKNRQAAIHAGMPVNRLTLCALLASGALAGLAGANDVLGREGPLPGQLESWLRLRCLRSGLPGAAEQPLDHPLRLFPLLSGHRRRDDGAAAGDPHLFRRNAGRTDAPLLCRRHLVRACPLAVRPARGSRSWLRQRRRAAGAGHHGDGPRAARGAGGRPAMTVTGIPLGAFLTAMLAAGLVAAVPLILAALGEAVGEKSGLLNLGIEGMMLAGAFFGFHVSYQTEASLWGIVAGMAAGAVLGLLFAFLTVSLRVDQVLVGLAITIFGAGLTAFLYRDVFGGRQSVFAFGHATHRDPASQPDSHRGRTPCSTAAALLPGLRPGAGLRLPAGAHSLRSGGARRRREPLRRRRGRRQRHPHALQRRWIGGTMAGLLAPTSPWPTSRFSRSG